MSTSTKKYRNMAFLLELMVNILVFSISCAVLVGLFGQAATLTQRSRRQAAAATELFSLVETIKARGPDALENVQWQDEENLLRYYDENWNATADENAPYRLEMRVGRVQFESGEMLQMEGRVLADTGEELYSLETASYHPVLEGGAA